MPSPDQIRTLETQIAPAAVASERLTGIPAEVIAAQCVLESSYLQKMPLGSKNPFGIKGDARTGVLAYTREWFNALELWAFLLRGDQRTAALDPTAAQAGVNGRQRFLVQDWFRKFGSLADAFSAHAQLLLKGQWYYAAARQYQFEPDIKKFIAAIGPHYATDPRYVEQLEEIALSKEVTEIVKQLREAVTGYGVAT